MLALSVGTAFNSLQEDKSAIKTIYCNLNTLYCTNSEHYTVYIHMFVAFSII
jgi:hypothetical protein